MYKHHLQTIYSININTQYKACHIYILVMFGCKKKRNQYTVQGHIVNLVLRD